MGVSYRGVILKAGLLLLAASLLFAWADFMPALGQLSFYNRLFPGRLRLPYGDYPERAYNLSLYNLEAMLASHELAGRSKAAGEFRVLFIGDSSTWGYLLPAGQTLTSQVNAMNLTLADGRRLRAYNLGYPVMSLTKDLLLLSYTQRYQPDLIVWLFTLESFPYDKQLFPPLLQNNPREVKALIARYGLSLDPSDPALKEPGFLERTLVGQRRALADLVRLQLYGVMWAATGVDQDIPATYTPRQVDLQAELKFHNLPPPHLQASDLTFEVLAAGVDAAAPAPVLLINEPMFVSQGKNSDLRYNFFYPRWAYDEYRQLLAEQCAAKSWTCEDMWRSVPDSEYTNSAVHLTPAGTARLAEAVAAAILKNFDVPSGQ